MKITLPWWILPAILFVIMITDIRLFALILALFGLALGLAGLFLCWLTFCMIWSQPPPWEKDAKK
jgi:hypothetical protein